ncbi:AAA family ATPase [Geotalea sp. SG265]|uniref:AAA family ATPase n=1 Tax=Geotalea sp. SG265 TaxID=2922867 RepID=UPI002434865E|nr:AAA family ATPase [Geotalea sp. SG265]
MMPLISMALIGNDTVARNDITGAIRSFNGQVGILATAADLQGGLRTIQANTPNVVLLEIGDLERGVKETSFIVSRWPETKVFALAAAKDPDWILKLVRAGATEYLTKPIISAELIEAIRKVAHTSGLNGVNGTAQGKTVTVFNPSGGVGTTTVAVNLAAALAAQGKKVALMDANLFCGNVTSFLDFTPRYDLSSTTSNLGRLDGNFLMSVMERHRSGLHVLSAPLDLEEAAEVTPEQLREVIAVMQEAFSYTIIDAGGPITSCNQAIFASSDLIFFTTVLDLPSLKNAKRYLPLVRKVAGPNGRIELLINRHTPKGEIRAADAEKILGTRSYCTIPNAYSDVRGAINKGQPVTSCSPRSPVTKAINELAQLLQNETVSTSATLKRTFFP